MKLEYLGHSCFAVTSDSGVKLVTDPYTGVGYELPKTRRADIVTISHGHFDHNCVSALRNVGTIVSDEGKLTVDGVEITGVESYHDAKQGSLRGKNIVFKIETDGVTVCHLGDIGEPCTDSIVEKIGKVDVLLIPVGGTYTIDAFQAKEYVSAIRPAIAIPMHYRPKDGTLDIETANSFLELYGHVTVAVPKNEIDLSKEELNSEKTEILFMERTEGGK